MKNMKKIAFIAFSFLSVISLKVQYLGGNGDGFALGSALPAGGLVYYDVDGLTDNTIDGAGLNTVNTLPLYVNYIVPGNVSASVPVAIDGSWSICFTAFDGAYFQLTTNQGTLGQLAPATYLPGNWVNIGEGNTAVGDGTPNGVFTIGLTPTATPINFGIQQKPNSGAGAVGGNATGAGGTNVGTGGNGGAGVTSSITGSSVSRAGGGGGGAWANATPGAGSAGG